MIDGIKKITKRSEGSGLSHILVLCRNLLNERSVPLILLIGAGMFLSCQPKTIETTMRQRESLHHMDSSKLMTLVNNSRVPVTVVNVWSTWCAPCKKEVPWLIDLQKETGIDLLFVSTDMEDQYNDVRLFAKEHSMPPPIYVVTETADTFIKAMPGKWSGALPGLWIFSQDGVLLDFWEGELSREDLGFRIRKHIPSNGGS